MEPRGETWKSERAGSPNRKLLASRPHYREDLTASEFCVVEAHVQASISGCIHTRCAVYRGSGNTCNHPRVAIPCGERGVGRGEERGKQREKEGDTEREGI